MAKIFCILIILTTLILIGNSQNSDIVKDCQNDCFNTTGCGQLEKCVNQIGQCQSICIQYQRQKQLFPCLKNCLSNKFPGQLDPKAIEFLNCDEQCVESKQSNITSIDQKQQQPQKENTVENQKPEPPKASKKQKIRRVSSKLKKQKKKSSIKHTKNEQENQQQQQQKLSQQELKIQNLKKQIAINPKSHPGTSLEILDCSNKNLQKLNIYIRIGNQHPMIINYFKSRCDVNILTKREKLSIGSRWFFKWVDFTRQVKWKLFKTGKQIINHIPNFQQLLSDKDGIYKTLSDFDNKHHYNFTSKDFHFDTYIFNLKSNTLNPTEQYFFDHVDNGYWLAKDPTGSLGLGIKLFRGTKEIKENIKQIKEKSNINKDEREIAKFSVIQKYLDNPLLLNKKKFDLRVYVLIASVDPFVLLFQQGFVRECIKTYDLDFKKFDFNEAFKHLTNRVYQSKHPDYNRHQEDLLVTPKDYEQKLKKEYGMTQNQVDDMVKSAQKTIAYSIKAAKEKFILKRGMFQLLGVDIIFDDQLKPYLIEYNTSAGLFTILQAHLNVVPQLVQTTLDLILKTHQNMDNLNEVWKHPENIELGRWQILQNDATGYDILEPHLMSKQVQQSPQKEDL